MGKHHIEKKTFRYNLLYKTVSAWHNLLFYRRITVINEDNIPKTGSIIFTPNHQNALMDALALLFNTKHQLVFVARADIFKNKIIASILYFFKILPIFRIRDGFDSLKNNKETFDKTTDVLKAGNGLVVLPEGNHGSQHCLRQLKKGFARIAFQTEEANDFNLDLKIVPVGIDYSNYFNMREDLLLNFGPALSISDYREQYLENQPQALNKIREDLAKEISKLMIDIKSKENYDVYENIRSIYNKSICEKHKLNSNRIEDRFKTHKILIDRLEILEYANPKDFNSLAGLVNKFSKAVKQSKLKLSSFDKVPGFGNVFFKAIVLFISLPIYFYAFILNFIPFQLSVKSIAIIKDSQFRSSIKFVVSMLMFPIFYILETLLIYGIFDLPIAWYYFVLSQIIAAGIAWSIHKNMAVFSMDMRFLLLKTRNKKVYNLLMKMHQQIIGKLDMVTANTES